jgi:dTDP-4-amino-4,6-dideoxygalactose transaminase
MPVVVEDESRRDAIRRYVRDRHGVQTSLFYPAIHEFTAYRERYGAVSLPRSEHIARAEITVPLFPEMDEPTQDRVVGALAEALS